MNCYQASSSSVSGEVPCYVKNEDTGTYLPVKSTLTEVTSIFYILNSSYYAVYDMVFFSEIAPTGKDGESLLFSLTRTDNGKFGFFYPTTYANRFQTRPDYIYDPSILLLNADDEGKDVVMNYELS